MKMPLLVYILLFPAAAFAQTGVTYHGRLIAPSGVAVTSSLVRFKIQIRSPGAENCLMFEEEQSADLSSTNGIFSLNIGNMISYRTDTTGLPFDRIFSNHSSFSLAGHCAIGTTYTPGYADGRKIEVSFNDGSFSGWEPMPAQNISYVPKALDALQVGGFSASNLLRVENTGVPQSVSSMTSTQFAEMMSLITGASLQYTKAGQLGGVSLPTLSGGQVLGWNGSTWTGVTPLTSYTETDPNVQAFAKTALPTCLAGEVLKSNGSSLSCVTDTTGGTPADATTSSKGIVQISATGGIDVNAGVIQLSDTGTAGTYYKVTTDAKGRVTSGSASLVEADIPNLTTAGKVSGSAINAGAIGGNTTINTSGNITTSGSVTGTTSVTTQNLRIFEGSNTYRVNVSAHSSLSANYSLVLPPALPGVSGQVLSSDTSGNLSWSSPSTGSVTSVSGSAPISVTGTSTPIVSISQAGSGSDGYLSSTDWNTFSGKLSSSSSLNGDVTGTPSATAIANNAVNSAKIADGTVGVADLNFAGSMATNTGLVVRNGTQFYNETCSGNETLIWTVANGWSCSSVVLTESDPKIGSNTTDYLSKWNGTALVTSGVYESGGNVGIGTASPFTTFNVLAPGSTIPDKATWLNTAGTPPFGIFSDNAAAGSMDFMAAGATNTYSTRPVLIGRKSRGTLAAPIALNTGDWIFSFMSSGYDGTGFQNQASIDFIVNGAVSMGILPTDIQFKTGSSGRTEKMRITSGGNVGIGMTSPQGTLHVNSAARTTAYDPADSTTWADVIVTNPTDTLGAASGIKFMTNATITGATAVTSGSGIAAIKEHATSFASGLSFIVDPNGSSSNEAMRITSTGNVGVGTVNPSQKLHVFGNLRVQGSTDCTLGNGSGGTNCSSDIRLKGNIQEIKNSLEKILSLRGVEFDWNEKSQSPGEHSIGVIAQDVEKQFPTAVIEDSDTGYKKVDYAVLVAPLIQAIKELSQRMTELFSVSGDHSREIASIKAQAKADNAAKDKEIAKLKADALKQKQESDAKIKTLEQKFESLEKMLNLK